MTTEPLLTRALPESEEQCLLVENETRVTGGVSRRVYWRYLRLLGLPSTTAAVLLFIVSNTSFVLVEWWVAKWASVSVEDQTDSKWIRVLVSLAATGILTRIVSNSALFTLLLGASTRLHDQMLKSVFRAPLRFFQTHPTGRIMNRFSVDMAIQDEELQWIAVDNLRNTVLITGTFVLIAVALPYMLPLYVLFGWGLWKIRHRYVVASREVKRFDGITRSPLFVTLEANIRGLATIRAYNREEAFQQRFVEALDRNGSWWTAFLLSAHWMGVRLDAVCASVMLALIIVAIILAKQVSAAVLGLALTHAAMSSGMLQWGARQSAEFENAMTAVERNLEYTQLEQEPPTYSLPHPSRKPLESVLEGLKEAARLLRDGPSVEESKPVLKGVSFSVPGGSSLGVVGRTGSGKSSLLLSLFRLIEVEGGQITIDGVDTKNLGIDVLRRQLAVIPQDPVLFGGTLRFNLDPSTVHSDARTWEVLERVCLATVVKAMGGLSVALPRCGGNLSLGQQQLLCLARALLSTARILALDEATANVDRATDALIQDSLKTEIGDGNRTLIIVAHRVQTVMDCDHVLVLKDGELVEFGKPNELLKARDGVFAAMVRASEHPSEDR